MFSLLNVVELYLVKGFDQRIVYLAFLFQKVKTITCSWWRRSLFRPAGSLHISPFYLIVGDGGVIVMPSASLSYYVKISEPSIIAAA
jgi:hypothetical protein